MIFAIIAVLFLILCVVVIAVSAKSSTKNNSTNKNNLIFYVICILASCVIFGTLYVVIPLFASIIDGKPLTISYILCGIVAVLSLLGFQFGKNKTQKILPLICAVLIGLIIGRVTYEQFHSKSYYKGLIPQYNEGLVNGFRKTVIPGRWGSFYLCSYESGGNEIIVSRTDYSYRIYTIGGRFLGEVNSLSEEGITILRYW